jgi:hypothetical protein
MTPSNDEEGFLVLLDAFDGNSLPVRGFTRTHFLIISFFFDPFSCAIEYTPNRSAHPEDHWTMTHWGLH